METAARIASACAVDNASARSGVCSIALIRWRVAMGDAGGAREVVVSSRDSSPSHVRVLCLNASREPQASRERMTHVVFRWAKLGDCAELAESHWSCWSREERGLFGRFGTPFLRGFYRSLLHDPSSLVLCATEPSGKIACLEEGSLDAVTGMKILRSFFARFDDGYAGRMQVRRGFRVLEAYPRVAKTPSPDQQRPQHPQEQGAQSSRRSPIVELRRHCV
jgi:hypothetical protein